MHHEKDARLLVAEWFTRERLYKRGKEEDIVKKVYGNIKLRVS